MRLHDPGGGVAPARNSCTHYYADPVIIVLPPGCGVDIRSGRNGVRISAAGSAHLDVEIGQTVERSQGLAVRFFGLVLGALLRGYQSQSQPN